MPGRELSEEAKALSALRKQKRAEAAATSNTAAASTTNLKGNILTREWVSLKQPTAVTLRIKIMTWNMLAQTLVRRELFPNSDCLKSGQREHMLTREVLTYDPDIACLQEVDRLEKHLPVFEAAGYAHEYASGPRKRHGCLILYKERMFKKLSEKTVFYDDVDLNPYLADPSPNGHGSSDNFVRDHPQQAPRIGSSFKTKNITLILALGDLVGAGGRIVATTHAFWHPKYKYERARQAGILLRSALDLQESDTRFSSWPIFISGDLNTEPNEAAYALLTGNPLLPHHMTSLQDSRVIHLSRDPSVAATYPTTGSPEDEDEGAAIDINTSASPGEQKDPDRVITNARPALPEDGLLSDAEMVRLYEGGKRKLRLRSGYDESLAEVPGEHNNLYGVRDLTVTYGKNEPMYTSFTHFWHLTLDYIFIADPIDAEDNPQSRVSIVGVLRPHKKKDLGDGLPKRGVCGSDHVALMIEVSNG
ncbi:hypothetical protein FRB94_001549 [Tulasnella sp. JGI-2019a]|nr:hypothetical protein FRB93_012513 [Tulasnella sp. JGI-2019a]KAG9005464.1 hypothetical protein FRB94_001549 [Tulasnella sp. JGI-2019a]KAG9028982.1 hypothetical protein FRB95_005850 [Tulasnella sp. JGI-2019a]